MFSVLFVLRVLACLLVLNDAPVVAKREATKCGACRLLLQELEYSINEVDPKKKIEVGSFRVDPKGNQYLNEVPYARSDVHIHELLEKVCERSERYGLVDHPITGRQVFAKLDELLGSAKPMIVETTADSVKKKLKFACESFLEEHEDMLVDYLKEKRDDPIVTFCHKRLDYCDLEELMPFPRDRDEMVENELRKLKAKEEANQEKKRDDL